MCDMVHVDEQLKCKITALQEEQRNREARDKALRAELQMFMSAALSAKDEQIGARQGEVERLRGAFEHGLNENAALFQSRLDAIRSKATAASNWTGEQSAWAVDEIEPRLRQATLLGDVATVVGVDEASQDEKDREEEEETRKYMRCMRIRWRCCARQRRRTIRGGGVGGDPL